MATIGHLLPWGSIGGVEVATLRIIKATRGEFHHVAFCMSKAMELQKAFAEAGAEVVSYDPPEPSLPDGSPGSTQAAVRLVTLPT